MELRSGISRHGAEASVVGRRKSSKSCKYNCQLQSIRLKQRLKFIRKNLIVAILAWLFMNTDPGHPQRVVASMLASRILRNSLQRSPFNLASSANSNTHYGLNTAEAIALIHALNSNGGGLGSGSKQLDLGPLLRGELGSGLGQSTTNNRQVASRQADLLPSNLLERQAAPTALAAVVAALAAFLAAVVAGLTPLAALAAAVAAAAAALLAALLAIVAIILPAKKKAPIVKKLVIKKTVLPFVIPIPYKKKEREVVYIPKPVHYKEHQHHHEEHKYKYKKHKKSDSLGELSYAAPLTSFPPRQSELGHLDKIDSVLSEQDRIQSIVDDLVDNTPITRASSTSPIISSEKSKHNKH